MSIDEDEIYKYYKLYNKGSKEPDYNEEGANQKKNKQRKRKEKLLLRQ